MKLTGPIDESLHAGDRVRISVALLRQAYAAVDDLSVRVAVAAVHADPDDPDRSKILVLMADVDDEERDDE